MSGNGVDEVCGARSGSAARDAAGGLLAGVSVRGIGDNGGVISPRQSESNNSTKWNDVQANSIGVNTALGWDYDFCRIEWPRSECLVLGGSLL